MLFHPKEPVNLGFYKMQGIFPKRKKVLAERLGAVVANNLLHFDDIKKSLNDPEAMSSIHKTIETHLDTFLKTKLKESFPMLAMFLSEGNVNKIKTVLTEEIEKILPEIVDNYVLNLEKGLDVEKIVKEKVEGFSSDKLEELLFAILKKEFRFIELVGAVLGFIIGIVQVLLVSLV